MLKKLDPLLNADLLYVLAAMGHGDDIAIVDANFPASAKAQRLVRMDGNTATEVMAAILTVMPLDTFVEKSCSTMAPVDNSPEPEVVKEFKEIANVAEGRTVEFAETERFEFYRQTEDAFAVISTGERRLYGNVLMKKGIVPPE